MRGDIAYWIALSGVPGVGPASFQALCERLGGPENVFHASRKELEQTGGLEPETVAALLNARRDISTAQETVTELDNEGFDVVTFHDSGYPAALRDLQDPPPLLYTLGPAPADDDRTFSVAGSTHPSARGAEIARAAGDELARSGWTVVSGYARGIDSAAHVGALEAGGRTVLVLPTGVRAFKLRPEFEQFREQLGANIVLVSECPPRGEWSSRNAVLRDRIIAALGRALLVVEARPDSGTMITFRHALRLGRAAYVVRRRRAPAGASGNELAIRAGGLPVASMHALREIARAGELPRAMPKTVQGELF